MNCLKKKKKKSLATLPHTELIIISACINSLKKKDAYPTLLQMLFTTQWDSLQFERKVPHGAVQEHCSFHPLVKDKNPNPFLFSIGAV